MEALTFSPAGLERRALSYEEYLALPDESRIVEWVDGELIVHMPPAPAHQRFASILEALLSLYVKRLNLGEVLHAPLEVKLWPNGPSREPDILFIGRERLDRLTTRRFEGAPDLIVEVISPTSVSIDRVDKYLEYERAGVREYWIIDPRPRQEQADFYVRGEGGRFVAAPIDDEGIYHSTAVPGFRLRLEWLRRPEQTDVERALAWMLADAPALSDELRAAYRRMLEALGG